MRNLIYSRVGAILIATNSQAVRIGSLQSVGPVFLVTRKPGTKRVRKQVFVCDCGEYAVRSVGDLKWSASCGCEHRKKSSRLLTVHGHYNTPEYRAWQQMKRRCLNKCCDKYSRYGGRGIRIHPAWEVDFTQFLADLGKMPGPGYSLDRYPDNNGNYEPGNCRWATHQEQCNNRTTSRWIDFAGERKTLAEWVRTHPFGKTIKSRIIAGWDVDRAFTEAVRK